MRFRIEQTLLACSLAVFGLSVGVLRALRNPNSRVSRAVDVPRRIQTGERHLRAVVTEVVAAEQARQNSSARRWQ